jgi:5-methylcytosine-specific restriction endonuclease McrA
VQADHLIPRAHGGPSVVENGLMLCPSCHERKTNHELLIQPEWLTDDQIHWLAENGYAWWDSTGEVYGTRRRIFAPRRTHT